MPTEAQQETKPQTEEDVHFSYRVPATLQPRFLKVWRASRRSKASLVHEGLEEILPRLEKRYAREIRQLTAKDKATK